MSEWTKVLLINVVLATGVVVAFLHAPATWAGVGAASAGLFLWAARKLRQQVRRLH
jgi:hypothetical protein